MRPWLVRFDLSLPLAVLFVALGWATYLGLSPVAAPGPARRRQLLQFGSALGIALLGGLLSLPALAPDLLSRISLGYVGVPGYYFWLTVGFLVCTGAVVREARRDGLDVRYLLDICLIVLFGAIVGARLGHILFERPMTYLRDPLKLFRFWEGGLVFYGGLLFCAAATWAYCRYRGLSFTRVADVLAPGVALGSGFGRIGCFSAGCCYGRPAGFALPWAVRFHHGQVPETLRALPLHPSQNYQTFVAIAVYLVVMRVRARQRFDGQAVLTFFACYAVGRSLVEAFRFDLGRVVYWNLVSTSQLISLPILLLSLGLLYRGWARTRVPSPQG